MASTAVVQRAREEVYGFWRMQQVMMQSSGEATPAAGGGGLARGVSFSEWDEDMGDQMVTLARNMPLSRRASSFTSSSSKDSKRIVGALKAKLRAKALQAQQLKLQRQSSSSQPPQQQHDLFIRNSLGSSSSVSPTTGSTCTTSDVVSAKASKKWLNELRNRQQKRLLHLPLHVLLELGHHQQANAAASGSVAHDPSKFVFVPAFATNEEVVRAAIKGSIAAGERHTSPSSLSSSSQSFPHNSNLVARTAGFHVVDMHAIVANFVEWKQCLSRVTPCFRVGDNRDEGIMGLLLSLGVHMCCSSKQDVVHASRISTVLRTNSQGNNYNNNNNTTDGMTSSSSSSLLSNSVVGGGKVDFTRVLLGADLSDMHPCRPTSMLKLSAEAGIRTYVVDSPEEVYRLARWFTMQKKQQQQLLRHNHPASQSEMDATPEQWRLIIKLALSSSEDRNNNSNDEDNNDSNSCGGSSDGHSVAGGSSSGGGGGNGRGARLEDLEAIIRAAKTKGMAVGGLVVDVADVAAVVAANNTSTSAADDYNSVINERRFDNELAHARRAWDAVVASCAKKGMPRVTKVVVNGLGLSDVARVHAPTRGVLLTMFGRALQSHFPPSAGAALFADATEHLMIETITTVTSIIGCKAQLTATSITTPVNNNNNSSPSTGDVTDGYTSDSSTTSSISVTSTTSSCSSKKMMYYIDDGCYGSMGGVTMAGRKLHPKPLHISKEEDGDDVSPSMSSPASPPSPAINQPTNTTNHSTGSVLLHPSSVWGPTCDGLDCVSKLTMLPEMDVGDWLMFPDTGIQSTSRGTAFNGLPSLDVVYCMRRDVRTARKE